MQIQWITPDSRTSSTSHDARDSVVQTIEQLMGGKLELRSGMSSKDLGKSISFIQSLEDVKISRIFMSDLSAPGGVSETTTYH